MDPAAKKTALRLLDYNLALIGSRNAHVDDDAKDLNAFLGSWIMQCSFDPPLLAVAIRKDSRSNGMVRESGVFTVNVLARDQRPIASTFLKDLAIENGEMGGLAYKRGATGAPVFPGLAAYVECEVRHAFDGGDHTLFVGEVVDAWAREEKAEPLRHSDTGWHYGG